MYFKKLRSASCMIISYHQCQSTEITDEIVQSHGHVVKITCHVRITSVENDFNDRFSKIPCYHNTSP